jgi:hypothetical protein
MGIFDRLKRKEKPADAARTSEPALDSNATTTADRPDFTLSVPFRWEAVPSQEGYEFRNRILPEQIIVTVLQHKRDLPADELEEAITRLVNIRRNAIGQLSTGKAVLRETVLTRSNGQVEARVIGEDAPNKVRLAFVVRGTPKKTVTVALTRYMLEEVGTPFADYAGVIFDLLKIKNG